MMRMRLFDIPDVGISTPSKDNRHVFRFDIKETALLALGACRA